MTIASLNPQQAYDILSSRKDAVLLDVRSRIEFDYVGHPIGAVHIAWAEFPTWRPDPQKFLAQARAAVGAADANPEARPILAICRSGARSFAALQMLAAAGFKELYNVTEGFEGDKDGNGHRGTINGWRQRGLPWIQT